MDATRARFAAGDPLRALAALSVFVHHAALWGLFVSGTAVLASSRPEGYGEAGARLLASLDVGLFIFFVLSGYLIARPFVRAFVAGNQAPRLGQYATRRLLRIVPAFWFVVALALLRHGSLGGAPSEVLAIFAFLQTFHQGGPEVGQAIGQAWTLHVEAGFYLLVPLAAAGLAACTRAHLGRDGRVALVVVMVLAVAGASLVLRHVLPHTQASLRSIPTVLFAFMPGVALAALESVIPARLRGPAGGRRAAYALLAAALALFAVYAWRRNDSPALSGLLATACASLVVAAPLLLQWSGSGSWRALDNRAMQWLGARSYSFYLVHNLVLWEVSLALGVIESPKVALLAVVPLGLAASVAASAVIYRFVERPFLDLRSRRRSPEQAQGTVVAPATYPAS